MNLFHLKEEKKLLVIDLVVLDCNLMGLASNYIGNHGVLNADEKILLRQYISELNKILFFISKLQKQNISRSYINWPFQC